MDKIYHRLEIIGITYNQIDKGVYALILQEVNGKRRIPIAIGTAEAQSIECRLQEIITPRPLTHDLMANIMRAFGIELDAVIIKQLPGGIFAADLILTDGNRKIELDSRSSDAIAIALRMNVPILTSEELLSQVSFVKDRPLSATGANQDKPSVTPEMLAGADDLMQYEADFKIMATDKLEVLLSQVIEQEQYEVAALIKKELDSRMDKNSAGQ